MKTQIQPEANSPSGIRVTVSFSVFQSISVVLLEVFYVL
ncbi:unnamed protein product [Schistosoma margrebowiei]|uniref:Uncharacterized protein n=1 Tax=Schistosoma margrebowiei TaxID=48269 RepID=A0A183M4D4_9TREM|nr:unnamed protein product [Schistosoma margrebowiei]